MNDDSCFFFFNLLRGFWQGFGNRKLGVLWGLKCDIMGMRGTIMGLMARACKMMVG